MHFVENAQFPQKREEYQSDSVSDNVFSIEPAHPKLVADIVRLHLKKLFFKKFWKILLIYFWKKHMYYSSRSFLAVLHACLYDFEDLTQNSGWTVPRQIEFS